MGGDVVSDALLGMDVSPYVVLAIMMAVVFFLGMFIDWAAILLVVLPIFTPIAVDLDINPLWFAMLVCINLQTSFLPRRSAMLCSISKVSHHRSTP